MLKVVSAILPSDEIQEKVRKEFPMVKFSFFNTFKEARISFLDADIFITYGEDLTEADINEAKNLKWIMVMSAGMELMPFNAIEEKGIIVTNAKGVHKIPMAEFTLGSLLQYEKQTKLLRKNEQQHIWDRKVPMAELCDKTILILGVGAIGGEIARLAKAFRMNTIGINRSNANVEFVDDIRTLSELSDVLPKADFVVSVLPSTTETKYLLTLDHFKLMKESAVFVNIGRGDLVKDEVITEALNCGHFAHAILDVFEEEPLPKGHSFWENDKVTVTPHLSSITKKYLPRSFEIFIHNLHTYMNQEEGYHNLIDVKRGY